MYLRQGLGTIVRITIGAVDNPSASSLKTLVDNGLGFAMQHFDRRSPNSEISMLARSSGLHRVSRALWMVLAISQTVCEATDGIFNVAYQSKGLKSGVDGCFRYVLDKPWTVSIEKNTRLDLEGIAKGWVIGRIANRLKALGYRHFMVEIGGDIVIGKGISGPWHIGIETPDKDHRGSVAILREENTSVFTSGTYNRGAHVFDLKTGKYPVRRYSVTVRGPDPAISDALATAALISGPGAGYYKRFPAYAFVFAGSDGLLDSGGLGFDEIEFP